MAENGKLGVVEMERKTGGIEFLQLHSEHAETSEQTSMNLSFWKYEQMKSIKLMSFFY